MPVEDVSEPVMATWTVGLRMDALMAFEAELDAFLLSTEVEGSCAFVIRMVVEEVVTNLVRHTPPGEDRDSVCEVGIELDERVVTLTIDDFEPSFDPRSAPELDTSAPLEQRRAGGMGLHLVRTMTESLTYEHLDGRNRLTATVPRT
jgi:serine/threonine-protein kinase RsbW